MNIQKWIRWIAVLFMFVSLRYLMAVGIIVWVGFPFYLKFANNSFGLAAMRWFSDAVQSPALRYLSAATVFFLVVGMGLYRFKRWSVILILCGMPLFLCIEFIRWHKIFSPDAIVYLALLVFFVHPGVRKYLARPRAEK